MGFVLPVKNESRQAIPVLVCFGQLGLAPSQQAAAVSPPPPYSLVVLFALAARPRVPPRRMGRVVRAIFKRLGPCVRMGMLRARWEAVGVLGAGAKNAQSRDAGLCAQARRRHLLSAAVHGFTRARSHEEPSLKILAAPARLTARFGCQRPLSGWERFNHEEKASRLESPGKLLVAPLGAVAEEAPSIFLLGSARGPPAPSPPRPLFVRSTAAPLAARVATRLSPAAKGNAGARGRSIDVSGENILAALTCHGLHALKSC